MKRNKNFRVILISITLVLTLLIVGTNVFIISVFGYHINSGKNIKEHVAGVNDVTSTLYAGRGTITDRNNSVLAQDVISYLLYANIDTTRFDADKNPAHVVDKEAAAKQLAPILDAPEAKLLELLSQDLKQVEFAKYGKNLDITQKQQIESLGIPGLGFTEQVKRNYPLEPFAPNVVGFAGFNENSQEIVGQLGLEKFFNDELKGLNGYDRYQQDGNHYKLRQLDYQKPVEGKNIKLTLDRSIQEKFEAALEGIYNDPKVQTDEIWGVIMEVKTGKILGWGEYPYFDRSDPNTNWNSRITQYEYEPGSTIKPFTIAAAINEGVYDPDDTYRSDVFHAGLKEGRILRLDTPEKAIASIYNAGRFNHGMQTYRLGFAVSSNVMISHLLSKDDGLDIEVFGEYLHKLGFFKKVGIDRMDEVVGRQQWSHPLDKLTSGYGQGSTVTMIQMMQAFTSIFGDGRLVKPYIVDEIYDPSENELIFKAETTYGERVFSEETAKEVQTAMRDVITNGGVYHYNMDEVSIIGKTGTAQYVEEGEGRYSKSKYIISMVLGFPQEDPEIVLYYAYKAPDQTNRPAAAEHIKTVLRQVLSVYDFKDQEHTGNVAPTQSKVLDNYVNRPVASTVEALDKLSYNNIVIGDGDVVLKQYPPGNTKALSNERVFLYTGNNNIKMPDMTGWSSKQVTNFWTLTKIEVEMNGQGFVTSQSIEPGTILKQDDIIALKLELEV